MPSPIGKTFAPSLHPALELIYLATLQPEQASQSLRKLLLANRNYFDSLPENSFKVVLNIHGDTTYESLGCVRYIPLLDQIYASIEIKRDCGYSFYLGDVASHEYVRFYISFDEGASWLDKGLTAIRACDEPGANPRLHLVTKSLGIQQHDRDSCVPFLIRAILAWNSPPPPDQPEWTPLWGNVVESRIQPMRPDARRQDRLQIKSWVQIAAETEPEERVGRSSGSAGVRPVGAPTPAGLPSTRTSQQNETHLCAI